VYYNRLKPEDLGPPERRMRKIRNVSLRRTPGRSALPEISSAAG